VSPFSSTLLKTWSGLTRWLLGLVALAWLLFGMVWGAIHWLIVPRIDGFRPQLEARATQAMGVPVRVGSVTARSDGVIPTFELSGVNLFDAHGRVALSLPRVVVTLSPRSLWRLGFEQLYIDQPKLDIRRGADGRILVAGLDFSVKSGADSGAMDWFFSQIELVIHDGTLRWTDEQRQVEPVVLQQVDIVLRNLGRHHDMRVDATPPPGWGERFGVQARFMQPLLSRQNGQWRSWSGQVFADFKQVDLSELGRHADPGVALSQGKGALRSWLAISKGRVTGVTTDMALSEVSITLATGLPPLALQQLQGRVRGGVLEHGFEVATESLAFDTAQGTHWPGGNVRVAHTNAHDKAMAQTELQADQLDLAALAQIAHSLPLQAGLREQLLRHAPKGRVDTLTAVWSGAPDAPVSYNAKGRLSQFELAAVATTPGVRGLNASFDLNQQSGRASLEISHGSIDVPAVFHEGLIPIDQLSASAQWQKSGDNIAFELTNVKFANADAQGEAIVKWQTSDPKKSPSHSRYPGLLDLQAKLSRADGRRVYRYLPLVIDPQARDYVREAVQGGSASNVQFLIKGDIADMPATDPRRGSFKISADVKDARLAYVPRSLQPAGDLPWPALTQLSGELLFDGLQLQVKNARTQLGEDAAVQATAVNVLIADLTHTEVKVDATLKGALPALLQLIRQSPVAALLDGALSDAVTSGNADYKLKLALPIADLTKSTVQGSVTLAGNDIQISSQTPRMTRARGVVNYSHSGFSLSGVQVRLLGGDARLDGGLVFGGPDSPNPAVIRASGNASAEGLRQAKELGLVARLAQQGTGSAAYTATLGLRRGALELQVNSNLQGMAAHLPAPLNKPAQALLPLRYQTMVLPATASANGKTPLHDRLSLSLGGLGSLVFERDMTGTEPKILRGAIGIGAGTLESVVLPAQGIHVNFNLPQFDADAWADVLAQLDAAPQPGGSAASFSHFGTMLLPTHLAVRCDALTFGERLYSKVVLGATRDGALWRANMEAAELNGYLEYRPPANGQESSGAGRVYARLARLTLAPGTAREVEDLFDAQPASIPALDIVVDDFELRGKRLGQLEVEAINRMAVGTAGVPEWRLNKFNLTVPEATLRASGNWVRLGAQASTTSAARATGAPEQRRSVMNFKLDIADGGSLLGRFGMKDVVRRASGKMEGQIAWAGSPLSIDYPSLSGAFSVNVTSGQFLKADPGIAKLLGVLSLQALPRRLTLDFRDVFSEGFAFDFLRGDITLEKGLARTSNLQMKGINAVVLMEGTADIAQETQNLKVVVIPEINAGTATLIATLINPAVGVGTFLAQLFLQRPLTESVTQQFLVNGSWSDPQVSKTAKRTLTPSTTSIKQETPP